MLSYNLLFLGTTEVLVIIFAIILIFGGRKIPELMRGLGRGVREFKEGQKEVPKDDLEEKNN